MSEFNWVLTETRMPDEGVKVIAIDPAGQEVVMFRKGRLWFHADNPSMYVYWSPSHWRRKVNL